MTRGSGRPTLVTTLVLALAAAPAAGQSVSGGPLLQSYTFSDPEAAGLETFRLLTVPWSASVALGPVATVSVRGAWAEGEASGPDGQATLSGLTDTDLNVSFGLGDWMVVGFDAALTTGKSRLTVQEAFVAGVVAAELLPAPINTWGSTGSLGGTFAVATQAGAWGIGFAGGYTVAREFEPIPGESLGYNPGDRIQARVAFDRDVGAASTLSIVAGYQRFSDDQVQGANLFQAGSRIEGTVALAFPVGLRSSALVYGAVNHRSQGTLLLDDSFLAGAADSPSQQLFLAGTNLRMPFGRSAALLPRAEVRVFRAEDGASQGWVSSAGTSLDLRLAGNSASRRLVLAPTGQLHFGRVVVREGAETGIFGWEAGLVLRVEGGR